MCSVFGGNLISPLENGREIHWPFQQLTWLTNKISPYRQGEPAPTLVPSPSWVRPLTSSSYPKGKWCHVGLASICHFLVLGSHSIGLLYFIGLWTLDPQQSGPKYGVLIMLRNNPKKTLGFLCFAHLNQTQRLWMIWIATLTTVPA
jgi:hypothetical protein